MRIFGVLCILFSTLAHFAQALAESNEKYLPDKNTCEIYSGVRLTSVNNTRSSHTSGFLKMSKPAPFRLGILALLVSDFVVDNFAEIGNGFQEFDVIKFYEEILKHGGTRGVANFKDSCFNSCMSSHIAHNASHRVVSLESISDKVSRTAICEALCDHVVYFLKSMDYFFLPTSELFELKISDKDIYPSMERERGLLRAQTHVRHHKNYHRETEERDDMARVQSFSSDNKLSQGPHEHDTESEQASSSFSRHEEDDSFGKDPSVLNFMEDKDFESDEMISIKSRLLLLWDVDKTLWDTYNFIQKGIIYGRAGKLNPYSMSLLFMIKERQQYDPRILDQYIITYGRGTVRKLQSPFLKSLCYSCWDLIRIYDRYFAEKQDSVVTQDFKRLIEAKEHNTISFNGDEFKFRNCPGPLKNLLFWRGKDMELFRNYIVSADEALRKEYYTADLTNSLTKAEIDYNFRYPFKTRNTSKIDEIVTVLIDDTISHLKLACIEEYHLFNMVVIPIIPFKGMNIDERIEMDFKTGGTSQIGAMTQELQDNDMIPIKGVNSIHIPFILNDALNQVPLNANATELSRVIRRRVSDFAPGRFPESQCNYDITNTKPIYMVFLSSCKFFNDLVTLFNNLPETHPTFIDIHYLLSSIDSWGFDDAHSTKMCSVVNDRIKGFADLCDKAKSGKLRESIRSEQKQKVLSRRLCSVEWKNKIFFGFALKEHYGPIPLNALMASLLPRRRTIILNIEADHLFNSIPLSMYENKFFYCTIKTNLFSSTFETIRKISIASRSTLKYANSIQNQIETDHVSMLGVLEVARNSTRVFHSNLINLFEKFDSNEPNNNKLHYKIYKEYTNCIFID
ncbi:putative signal peptide-containing protein [Cryptosporidium canis]|uniref:Signal peptide-containing protein n=1 Tax=Cryptosporidium canis TaxID=195482 RepID=A0A9D5DI72_9CRYT|nr:putative signal peptide-containing protein [Cryptosporidium canis]